MSAGDHVFNGKDTKDRMEMDEKPEGRDPDLLDTEEGYIKEEHSNPNPSSAETGDSSLQEMTTDEEAEKLQIELDVKRVGTSSTEDYGNEKGKDGLEARSDNRGDTSNQPWTLVLPETGKWEFASVNEGDETTFIFEGTKNDSLEKEHPKNPLLLIPVIRCVLKFLNIKDVKNCRLVSREWGFNGKLVIANRARIRLDKRDRLPKNFQACFPNSENLFSSFEISGTLTKTKKSRFWTVEELTQFFDQHQKYIKELDLQLEYSHKDPDEKVKNIDMSSWISKSLMVQKDAKYMTKLIAGGDREMFAIPSLQLIQHIKVLALWDCRINIEVGIRICPITLQLYNVKFYQDGVKLDSVRVNDIVDLGRAKEILLTSDYFGNNEDPTKYTLDMRGNVILDILNLKGVQIVNGETSQWIIETVGTTATPYSFHNQIKIKKLDLSGIGTADLFTLPNSLQNLTLKLEEDTPSISCSQPFAWEKLQYLQIGKWEHAFVTDYSFLSHFRNCPQLTHLLLDLNSALRSPDVEINSHWIPKSVTTLILQSSSIKSVQGPSLNLKKLVLHYVDRETTSETICKTNIHVDEIVLMTHSDEFLVSFLKNRKRFSFGKTLYVGGIRWCSNKFEDSVLKEHTDAESPFYVFENEEKGRAFSKQEFYELLPKHLPHIRPYLCCCK